VLLPRSIINAITPFVYGATNTGIHGKYLEDFAVGMLLSTCYTIVRTHPTDGMFNTLLRHLSPWLLISGMIWLVAMAAWKLNWGTPHTWPSLDYLTPYYDYLGEIGFALGYGLCVAAVLFGFSWLKRPFEWSPLRWIGLISYGLYMWHLRLLQLFTEHVVIYISGWKHLLLYSLYWGWLFVFIIPCVLVLFLLVEKPWMQLGDRLRTEKKITA
jgi:peptidoglycan/LPS O-acetylase OafA/YrhL